MPTSNVQDEVKVFDVWKVRKDFPILNKTMNGKPLIYLDSAATAQKPSCVIDAISNYYREEYGTVHRAIYELAARSTEMYAAVRGKVKSFINAGAEEEIIFTRGTTESINLVAYTFGKAFLKEGDEVIITAMEHHANIVPWQMACERTGAKLKHIPMDENGELDIAAFKVLLSEKTKLVAFTHISNVTGIINPVKTIIQMAHKQGAKVLIDGAQAVAHLPIDVQELDVDFYAFSGHKIYGPTGVGILYGKRQLLEELPPFMGGGDMIENVTLERSIYQELPLKFEAGTPSIAEVIGLGAAIDYIKSIGKGAIYEWEQQVLSYATEKLQEVPGVTLYGASPEKGNLISFTVEGIHPLDLGTILGLKGVAIRTGHLCAMPSLVHFGVDALARISFGLYTTHEEIDTFIHALKEATMLLKPELSY